MKNKLIIMLSAKRCGSTALFKMFQNNKLCKIAHKDQNIENWEIQFWSLASKALKGKDYEFRKRLKKCLPEINVPNKLNKKKIFKLWSLIHGKVGKVIFDKSPQYLGDRDALTLLYEYCLEGNDVKIFCFIRNPLDAITSQHELWHGYTKEKNLIKREKDWLIKYKHFEDIKKKFKIKFFKYENFVTNPDFYGKKLMNFCEIPYNKSDWQHIKPVSIGRYNSSLFKNIKNWEVSTQMIQHMKKYNYKINNSINILQIIKILLNSSKRYIPTNIKKIVKNYIS